MFEKWPTHVEMQEAQDALVGDDEDGVARGLVHHREPVHVVLYQRLDRLKQRRVRRDVHKWLLPVRDHLWWEENMQMISDSIDKKLE